MIIVFMIAVQAFLLLITKSICKPFTFKMILYFNLWWMLLVILSKISPVGDYEITLDAYTLILLFVFFVSAGFIFFGAKKQHDIKKVDNKFAEQFDNSIYNNKLLLIFTIICSFALAIYAVRYNTYIDVDNILEARNARFYVGAVFHSTAEILFYDYIISSVRFVWAFIVAFAIVYRKKPNLLVSFSALNFILYCSIGASRFPIVSLGVTILVLYIVKSDFVKGKRPRRIGKYIGILISAVILFFGMAYFTAYRLGMLTFDWDLYRRGIYALYEQIAHYNIGAIGGLSKTLENGILHNRWLFGQVALLGGVEEILDNLLGFLGISWDSAIYEIASVTNQSVSFGTTSINALFTDIYWFYADMGVFGVCAYATMFGMTVKAALNRFMYERSIWMLMILTHLLASLFLSNLKWSLTSADSMIFMLFVCTYIRSRSNKKKEKKATEEKTKCRYIR